MVTKIGHHILLLVICSVLTTGCKSVSRKPSHCPHGPDPSDKSFPNFKNAEEKKSVESKAAQGDGYSAFWLSRYNSVYLKNSDLRDDWLFVAAQNGYPAAQHNYGSLLYSLPVPSAWSDARVWLKKAAQQGYKPSLEGLDWHERIVKMGEDLALRKGLNPGPEQALVKWMKKRAANGQADFIRYLKEYKAMKKTKAP